MLMLGVLDMVTAVVAGDDPGACSLIRVSIAVRASQALFPSPLLPLTLVLSIFC